MKLPLRELRAQILECIRFNEQDFDLINDGERITISAGFRESAAGPVRPNLWVSDPFLIGSGLAVTVTPGYLTYQLLLKQDDTGGPLHYDTPTINSIAIDAPDVGHIEVAGAGHIYMHCTTDNRGVPTMTPEINFYAEAQESIHHVPESIDFNSEPVDGDYYWPLATIEEIPDSDPIRYRTRPRLPGDKFIPNQIDRMKNIGDGTPLYWGFDASPTNAAHKLRSIANASDSASAGATLVKALGAESDEEVKIKTIKAGTGITITDGVDSLEIAADESTTGQNFDLVNYDCVQDPGGPAPSPNWTISFRAGKGYYTGAPGAPDTTLVHYNGFSCYPGAGGP
jgi:hypothetical protein